MENHAELGQALVESLLICLLLISVLVLADAFTLHQKKKAKKEFRYSSINSSQGKWKEIEGRSE